jgi:hypothetical protein
VSRSRSRRSSRRASATSSSTPSTPRCTGSPEVAAASLRERHPPARPQPPGAARGPGRDARRLPGLPGVRRPG